MFQLPVHHILPELLTALQTNPNTVLSAPPGAGKTTRVPLELLNIIPPERGRIVMLEPRRIAVVSAAGFMAQSIGELPGNLVGYSIRFESKVSTATRIEVVTEGVLTRRIQKNPDLTGVACVIFDEFHERSIHADLGLALCLEIQAALRPDLKLLVMSATIDCEPIARLLGNAPVIISQGRAFPVQIRYPALSEKQPFYKQMASVIRTALTEEPGDLLAFLPGSAEIRAVSKELEGITGAMICPLFGDLPFDAQQQAILPGSQRRVILATNIAETSLTIEGVRIVVDSGLTRCLQFNPSTGLEHLVTTTASKASADQRAGRAGRDAPGFCYRLYSQQRYQAMTQFSPPELMTADLAPLMLELAAWGVADPNSLNWLDQPPAKHIEAAQRLLIMLGALDKKGRITDIGRQMVCLPLPPRLSRMILFARDHGQTVAGCYLAASFLNRSATTLNLEKNLRQLLRLMGEKWDKCPGDPIDILYTHPDMAVAAWPDRIAMLRQTKARSYLLASGRGAQLSGNTGCNNSEFLVALQVDGGSGADGVIHQAVPVSRELLRSCAAGMISRQRQVLFDDLCGRVVAAEQERIGVLIISTRQVQATDAEAAHQILEQIVRSGTGILGWSETARQFQARVCLAARLLPEEDWPDISDDGLVKTVEQWLAPHLAGVRSIQELKRIDLLHLLQKITGWKRLKLLDSVTPSHFLTPSGKRIALDYRDQEGPVLSVKLQELFGLSESPTVCRSRRTILIHLLSPAGRPAAITRDLKGFWERGYSEVRKELRGRYPKHSWPEDPLKKLV